MSTSLPNNHVNLIVQVNFLSTFLPNDRVDLKIFDLKTSTHVISFSSGFCCCYFFCVLVVLLINLLLFLMANGVATFCFCCRPYQTAVVYSCDRFSYSIHYVAISVDVVVMMLLFILQMLCNKCYCCCCGI